MKPDPIIPELEVPQNTEQQEYHTHALAVLIIALHNLGLSVNYNHIVTTVPKNQDIPLYSGVDKVAYRADLAYALAPGVTAQVWVTVARQHQAADVLQLDIPLIIQENSI